MKYVLARLQRLLKHLASPRGALIIVTAVAVGVALLAPWTALRVAAAVVAIGGGASVALLVSDRQAAEHRRLRTLEDTQGRELADIEALVAAVSQHEVEPPPGEFDPADEPLVSVVITSWNEAPFIATAIESVRRQTLGTFECIIVDDASTDASVDVALEAIANDPRFRLVRHDSNRGLGASRNTGLSKARAPYVAFLDGDDFLYPRSLQVRLESLVGYRDQPWVVGTFSQWVDVSEHAEIGPTPVFAWRKDRRTWLSSLRDAPFIATAPLLRTDVARSVGGFSDVSTAEDALYWNRLLRHGYVFEPVHEVGVAYRMRQRSKFRRTAAAHAEIIAGSLKRNAEPATDLVASAPFAFGEACTAYEWELTRVKRLVSALASAVEAGDEAGTAAVLEELSRSLAAYHLWELPLETVIANAATRVSRHTSDAELAVRKRYVAEEVSRLLEPAVAGIIAGVEARQQGLAEYRRPLQRAETAAMVAEPERLSVSPVLLDRSDSEIAGKVILMPTAAYHVDETGPIATWLADMGIDSVVMVSDRRWPSIANAQAGYETPVLATVEPGAWLKQARAVVVMNDWGEDGRAYVDAANQVGVPTFAKVEGVQDFEDDDVHWERGAYQRGRWILAQGSNDVRALPDQDTIVVSSSRIEKIWLGPPRSSGPELAVINLNFAYGVLEDARDLWLSTAIEACETLKMPFVLSLHPAERDRFSGRYPIASAPMRHLLTEASALISRFSTVPFEAMARGVPFVYHNPHGERVPTFSNPVGAFEVTASASDLAEALVETRAWQDNYRDRCADFLLSQIDVDPDRPSALRAAEVIAARVGGI